MGKDLIAQASVRIRAGRDRVWRALTDPAEIRQYMFGAEVMCDWLEGSPIVWKGMWNGRPYEDKGRILRFAPKEMLQYSHFSPLSGLPDIPENYHTVTIILSGAGSETTVDLAQDKNGTETEKASSEKNWELMLATLKKQVEGPGGSGTTRSSARS